MSRPGELVAHLARRRVLVVGDLVLDEYVTGKPSRISREAPVLILEHLGSEYRAGSAASPAANVAALGSVATIVGVVGADPAGDLVETHLEEQDIRCEGLVRAPEIATARKTRILAEGFTGGRNGRQQVLRLDSVPTLPESAQRDCAGYVARLGPANDAILLSDYRGGVVTEHTIAAAQRTGRPVTVDSQGDLRRFAGVELLKVNQAEAYAALGAASLEDADLLRRSLGVRVLVVTLGADGMAIFTDGGMEHVPAVEATEVFDVTGAGDTVIAVLTLGLIAGIDVREAGYLANLAASRVIRRLGVATVSPSELASAASETRAYQALPRE